jgi:hypothetical protein
MMKYKYKGYTLQICNVEVYDLRPYRAVWEVISSPCLLKGKGKNRLKIPLCHYLPTSHWGAEGFIIPKKDGCSMFSDEYTEPIPLPPGVSGGSGTEPIPQEEFSLPKEIREKVILKVNEWNSEIPNWTKSTKYTYNQDSFNDKDEMRLDVSESVYYTHPSLGKRYARPEPTDLESELESVRKAYWSHTQYDEWCKKGMEIWIELYKEALDKAIEDQGALHQQKEKEKQKEGERREKEYNKRKSNK